MSPGLMKKAKNEVILFKNNSTISKFQAAVKLAVQKSREETDGKFEKVTKSQFYNSAHDKKSKAALDTNSDLLDINRSKFGSNLSPLPLNSNNQSISKETQSIPKSHLRKAKLSFFEVVKKLKAFTPKNSEIHPLSGPALKSSSTSIFRKNDDK